MKQSKQILHVVFKESTKRRWHQRYFKYGFTHCFVLIQELSKIVQLEPLSDRLWINVCSFNKQSVINIFADKIYTVLTIECNDNVRRLTKSVGIFSCVNVVKYTLGIRCFLVFTPYQLYKKLLKMNGKQTIARVKQIT